MLHHAKTRDSTAWKVFVLMTIRLIATAVNGAARMWATPLHEISSSDIIMGHSTAKTTENIDAAAVASQTLAKTIILGTLSGDGLVRPSLRLSGMLADDVATRPTTNRNT
ncbi:hypothetical protein GQ607_014486 [Colletotrichum asianum]|uniref:Uncharacterized protein n=1 Tax=Colletotrichum asianum TaxID=702518 RepID=A0A8H3ZFX6_9PEZI|nr:hypothetical protein GQ607_014486 [Colletotrichum asianum]